MTGKNVLVVDDDRDLAMSLADVLAISGHTAKVVHNGEDAVAQVSGTPFDLVLVDYDLPRMNGAQVMASIRTQKPGLPVRLMTAYSAQYVQDRSADTVDEHILIKPLDLDWLLGFLEALA